MEENLSKSVSTDLANEQKLDIDTMICNVFDLPKQPIHSYSPLALAYIGDGIYDLVVRSVVIGRGNMQANKLHQATSHYVKAKSQSYMMDVLMPMLTETEVMFYKRGRNAKSVTTAKNASIGDYRRATGFEALMGYLYLTDQMPRLLELVACAMEHLPEKL